MRLPATALLLTVLLSARPASAEKKVVQGAPIFVDENGRVIPPPKPAAVPASAPPAGGGGEWKLLLTGTGLIAFLVWLGRALQAPRASFAFEPEFYAPGETAKGTLLTGFRPDSVKAVLELYRADDDRPVRSVPATVGEPVSDHDGWRTPIAAFLPPDARPDFEGGWALSVEAVFGGRAVLAGDNVELRSFWLDPAGPRAAGETVRAQLETAARPAALKATLDLVPEDPDDGTPLRSLPAAVGEPRKSGGGWRTIIEARLPDDARRDPANGWILQVADGADLLEVEEVALRARV